MLNRNIRLFLIFACLSLCDTQCSFVSRYKPLFLGAATLFACKIGVSREAGKPLVDCIDVWVQSKKLVLKKSIRTSLGIPLLKNPVVWAAFLGSGIVGGILALLIWNYTQAKVKIISEQISLALADLERKFSTLNGS